MGFKQDPASSNTESESVQDIIQNYFTYQEPQKLNMHQTSMIRWHRWLSYKCKSDVIKMFEKIVNTLKTKKKASTTKKR